MSRPREKYTYAYSRVQGVKVSFEALNKIKHEMESLEGEVFIQDEDLEYDTLDEVRAERGDRCKQLTIGIRKLPDAPFDRLEVLVVGSIAFIRCDSNDSTYRLASKHIEEILEGCQKIWGKLFYSPFYWAIPGGAFGAMSYSASQNDNDTITLWFLCFVAVTIIFSFFILYYIKCRCGVYLVPKHTLPLLPPFGRDVVMVIIGTAIGHLIPQLFGAMF